jgi:hypothetical protein
VAVGKTTSPILLTPYSTNQSVPSDAAAMAAGWELTLAAAGTRYSAIAPAIVMRPIWFIDPENQMAPSAPVVIP